MIRDRENMDIALRGLMNAPAAPSAGLDAEVRARMVRAAAKGTDARRRTLWLWIVAFLGIVLMAAETVAVVSLIDDYILKAAFLWALVALAGALSFYALMSLNNTKTYKNLAL